MKNKEHIQEKVYRGIPASPGYIVASCHLFLEEESVIVKRHLSDDEVNQELNHFFGIFEKIKTNIEKEMKIFDKKSPSYKVLQSHLLLVSDAFFLQDIENRVRLEKLNVDYIFVQVLQNYFSRFLGESDTERHEILDEMSLFSAHIVNALNRRESSYFDKNKSILVAHDLSPSQTVQIRQNLLGIVTDSGSQTSHVSILARSLSIPAVVGLKNISFDIEDGDVIVIDGCVGQVIVRPSEETIACYKEKKKGYEDYRRRLEQLKEQDCQTRDGAVVELMANIEFPEEVQGVKEINAEGVGLFRTEFLYMNRSEVPSEEEHFDVYKKMVIALEGRPFIIRTLDIGGDKFTSVVDVPQDVGSFLGLRAIRLCLHNQDILLPQLYGIARASQYGPLHLLFPMISNIQEVQEILGIWENVLDDLGLKKEEHSIRVGFMIETPAAAMIADKLASYADFFSIGTNDLIQYSLAVERGNEYISHLYQPFHPAMLKLLEKIVKAAKDHDVDLHVCGEMAGECLGALLLVALGVRRLSMSPMHLLRIKDLIMKSSLKDLEAMYESLRCLERSDQVQSIVESYYRQLDL